MRLAASPVSVTWTLGRRDVRDERFPDHAGISCIRKTVWSHSRYEVTTGRLTSRSREASVWLIWLLVQEATQRSRRGNEAALRISASVAMSRWTTVST